MTKRLAQSLDLKKGDQVLVVPSKGLQKPVYMPIAGIVESMFGLSVYADYDYLNRMVDQTNAVSKTYLKTSQTPEQKRVFLRQIKELPGIQTFTDNHADQKTMEVEFVQKMGGMVYPLILFGAVIFLGSILNSSLISIIERQREIATFRALGYTPMEIGGTFLRENMIINVADAILGLPVGWLLLKGLAMQYTNELYAMPCIVSRQSWILTMVLVGGVRAHGPVHDS